MNPCQWMTEKGHKVPDVQALLRARSRNTVYRHLRAANGEKNGQIPDQEMMRRWAEISDGQVLANDFHGQNRTAPRPHVNGTGGGNGAAAGSSPDRGAVVRKRARRSLAVSIAASKKGARVRKRQRETRA